MTGLPVAPWEGQAVLCFRRSCWFEDVSGSLVGLVAPELAGTPGALTLEGSLPAVRVGARLALEDQQWRLEGVGALTASSASWQPWGPGSLPSWSLGWRSRWAYWFAATLPRNTEGLWLQSLLWGPPDDWESLMGRGSGSTPSGDDYLAGWLAVLHRRGRFDAETKRRLVSALPRTTRLSRHYLGHLAEGWVDPALTQFLEGDTAPEPGSAEALRLVVHGDLSGSATLIGLVAGLTQES